MNVRMILRIQSQALLSCAVTMILPIVCALLTFGALDAGIVFTRFGGGLRGSLSFPIMLVTLLRRRL